MRGRLKAHFRDWVDVETANRQLLGFLDDRSIGYQVECTYWIALALHEQGKSPEAHSFTQEASRQSRKRTREAELESAIESCQSIKRPLVDLDRMLLKVITSGLN
jgi:hypothetical protein